MESEMDKMDKIKNMLDRFKELEKLNDGWFEGAGKAPNIKRLKSVSLLFITYYDFNSIPNPIITPTFEGNIFFEWIDREEKTLPSLEINLDDNFESEFIALDKNKDIEYILYLNKKDDWVKLNDLLIKYVNQGGINQ